MKSEQQRAVWELTQLQGWELVVAENESRIRDTKSRKQKSEDDYYTGKISAEEFNKDVIRYTAEIRTRDDLKAMISTLCGE